MCSALPSLSPAEVFPAPYAPGFAALLGCVLAHVFNGTVAAEQGRDLSFTVVLAKPEMFAGAIAAVGAFAPGGHVEQGAGELVGGGSGGHVSASSMTSPPSRSRS